MSRDLSDSDIIAACELALELNPNAHLGLVTRTVRELSDWCPVSVAVARAEFGLGVLAERGNAHARRIVHATKGFRDGRRTA